MKIKLFKEYKLISFDFNNYNVISENEHGKLLNSNNWLLLSEFELKKLEKYVKTFKKKSIVRKILENTYYTLSLINESKFSHIDLVKLPDDYYLIDFFYGNDRYHIKCDQLLELLKLLKYMSEI